MKLLNSCIIPFCFIAIMDVNAQQQTNLINTNALWPSKLILANNIGCDTLFTNNKTQKSKNVPLKPIFEISQTNQWLQNIINAAIEQKIPTYNPTGDRYYPYITIDRDQKLTKTHLLQLLSNIDDSTSANSFSNNQVSTTKFDTSEIKSINFIEEWIFNNQTALFSKKVIAIEPVRHSKIDYGDYVQKQFIKTFRLYTNNDNVLPSETTKVAHIKYEHCFNMANCYLDENFEEGIKKILLQLDEEKESDMYSSLYNAPLFNRFNQQLLVDELLRNVYEGKLKAFDYKTNNPLTATQAKSRIIFKDKTQVYNAEGELVEDVFTDDVSDEIISFLFIEDWYMNPVNFAFAKKVRAIAPIRYYIDYEGSRESIKRIIPFIIYFN